ncbi:MAG: AraC family transcriptional regulator [Eubacteriales bacterium]|nr:AraC family transcriptional regulator [Eubacteriales bacterium]
MKNRTNTTIMKDPAYQETKRHSDTMFAFNIYPCTIPTDFTFVPLHWQESMEIIYVKQGSGIVQVDLTSYTAQAGDIFFVLPGHLHGLRRVPKMRMEYENIIFDMNFLGSDNVDLCSQKYLRPIINGTIQFPPRIGREHPLYAQVSSCLDASDRLCSLRPNGYELGVKGNLLVLFSILLQTAEDKDEYPADHKNMQKLKTVLSRIEKDYNKKLTVNSIADECGYSPSHFMRWFKEATGTGFAGYLIEYRLNQAARALRSSNVSILEIAQQTGFDNLSNFNRLFKRRFEMTPSQFRRQEL